MNNVSKQLISLVSSALNNSIVELYPQCDWQELYNLSSAQDICSLIADQIRNIDAVPKNIKKKFEEAQYINICRETNQDYYIKRILNDFEENKINNMVIKGYILKNMYPSSLQRSMCDIDILINPDDYEKINSIMLKNGFTQYTESNHEYIYIIAPYVTVELHKKIVPDYNHDLYKYYKNIWEKAKLLSGTKHRYELSFEDFYIYTIVHAAKHYINGGIGIRHIADIYVLIKNIKFKKADSLYIKKELETLELTIFEKIIHALSESWFGGADKTEQTLEMGEYVLSGGIFGNAEYKSASVVYRQSENKSYVFAKICAAWKMIFPPRKTLELRYNILKSRPILYPFYIIYRWIDVILHRRSNIKTNMAFENITNDKVKEFETHCSKMGLKKTL